MESVAVCACGFHPTEPEQVLEHITEYSGEAHYWVWVDPEIPELEGVVVTVR